MGTDNLHHKRKAASLDSYKRKAGNRARHAVVLIVCEDEKSGPNYIRAYCDHLKLNRVNIRIEGKGKGPEKVVDWALKEYKKAKTYDRVYCVFDKDEHSYYKEALNRIEEHQKNSIPIYAITSVPCFEYWLLLHFVNSSRPYDSLDALEPELKKYIPDYFKGQKNIFELTKRHLKDAMSRAKKIRVEQMRNKTDNPSTNTDELIEYLTDISRNKER